VKKRLIIGAIAVVVIGVAVYFLSQPKEGTVEWHKRQYLKAFERITQTTWKDKLQRVYRRILRQPPPDSEAFRSDGEAFDHHLASLVRFGYLQETRVSLTNAHANYALRVGYPGGDSDEALRRFIVISIPEPHVLRIIAPTSDLPIIEAAIRQVDVPMSE
jgi:hypothetical protein